MMFRMKIITAIKQTVSSWPRHCSGIYTYILHERMQSIPVPLLAWVSHAGHAWSVVFNLHIQLTSQMVPPWHHCWYIYMEHLSLTAAVSLWCALGGSGLPSDTQSVNESNVTCSPDFYEENSTCYPICQEWKRLTKDKNVLVRLAAAISSVVGILGGIAVIVGSIIRHKSMWVDVIVLDMYQTFYECHTFDAQSIKWLDWSCSAWFANMSSITTKFVTVLTMYI